MTDADLAELDDWLGTLEELQTTLAYESSVPRSPLPDTEVDLPRNYPDLAVRGEIGIPVRMRDKQLASNSFTAQSIRASFNVGSCREATAENDLNCLLRELKVVEEKMKELEQCENDFTRRYSLVSSNPPDLHLNSSDVPNHSFLSYDSCIQDQGLRPLSGPAMVSEHVTLGPLSAASGHRRLAPGERISGSSGSGGSGVNSSRGAEYLREESRSPSPGLESMSTEDCELDNRSLGDCSEIAHKINEVMERVEKMDLKKIVVRVFRPDKTTKAILVDEQMRVGEVCAMLTEKNFLMPSVRLSLVEKVPNLKMERPLEDHESLADCILSWPENSKNMIFFEERIDKFAIFENPSDWIGEDYADSRGRLHPSAAKDIFCGAEPLIPDFKDYLYIKKPSEKTWTRKFCVVRNSGLYASKKKKSTSTTDLVRILIFDPQFHLYTTSGGWSKLKAPTPYGFALKPSSAQDRNSKFVFYFCASDEASLRRWCSLLRIAKCGRQLLYNYEAAFARVNAGLSDGSSTLGRRLALNRKASCDALSSHTRLDPNQMPRRSSLNAHRGQQRDSSDNHRSPSRNPRFLIDTDNTKQLVHRFDEKLN